MRVSTNYKKNPIKFKLKKKILWFKTYYTTILLKYYIGMYIEYDWMKLLYIFKIIYNS